MFITNASLHNYADDHTLSAYSSDLNLLIEILAKESQTTRTWLKVNHMIVNPKKIQVMLVFKRKTIVTLDLAISSSDVDIKPENSIKL